MTDTTDPADTTKTWIEERRAIIQGARETIRPAEAIDLGLIDLPRTLDALTTIIELHTPVTEYGPDYFTGQYPCEECNRSDQEGLHPTTWPCPTIQAIHQATTNH